MRINSHLNVLYKLCIVNVIGGLYFYCYISNIEVHSPGIYLIHVSWRSDETKYCPKGYVQRTFPIFSIEPHSNVTFAQALFCETQ